MFKGNSPSSTWGWPVVGSCVWVTLVQESELYTGTVCDALWRQQHYRYESTWSRVQICSQCFAENAEGPLNWAQCCAFPKKTHEAYVNSEAARRSPLSRMIGFWFTMTRGELMHIGPLGVMPDAVGSAVIELCDEGKFGVVDAPGGWEFRLGAQLSVAYSDFAVWCTRNHSEHTIKSFGVRKLSMLTLNFSWPSLKGKAHNCLVVTRWLSAKCSEYSSESEYALIRSTVITAWADFFHISAHTEDPNWMNDSELAKLQTATDIILHGTNALASMNAEIPKLRWKMRCKMHELYHVNEDAQTSHRPPRAFWSFKDEEFMGKLSLIACAVHALGVVSRTLERWGIQLFNAMDD